MSKKQAGFTVEQVVGQLTRDSRDQSWYSDGKKEMIPITYSWILSTHLNRGEERQNSDRRI